MRKSYKKLLSLLLSFMMLLQMFPVIANAAAPSSISGENVQVALYRDVDGAFPSEPAHQWSASDYMFFNSSFEEASMRWFTREKFSSDASQIFKEEQLLADIVLGENRFLTGEIWGVFHVGGIRHYLQDDAITAANEQKMIEQFFSANPTELGAGKSPSDYRIIWYVIKHQNDGWHMDGLVLEKETFGINYNGNGNTDGDAPSGTTGLLYGASYQVAGNDAPDPMVRKEGSLNWNFIGWNDAADGSGTFFKPGETITVTKNQTLYAMWQDPAMYTATVNIYLDGQPATVAQVHGSDIPLYLSSDGVDFLPLVADPSQTGVYHVQKMYNGNFYLYHLHGDEYEQVGISHVNIYNQNGSMDAHHFSVNYDLNGGSFAAGEDPGTVIYAKGAKVYTTASIPVKEDHIFTGWLYGDVLLPAGDLVSTDLNGKTTLTAQWIKAVDVKFHVTINHGEDNHQTMNEVKVSLVRTENGINTPVGDPIFLSDTSHNGFTYIAENGITTYTANGAAFKDLPEAVYTVTCNKRGYSTVITAGEPEADGTQVIYVELTYAPEKFDLDFTVKIDPDAPKELYPTAVNVRVQVYKTDEQGVTGWHIINAHAGSTPPVSVKIDPQTGMGTGFYPVGQYWSDSEHLYLYRIVITSYVLPDGTVVRAHQDEDGQYVDDAGLYSGVTSVEDGGKVAVYPSADPAGLIGAYYDPSLEQEQSGMPTAVVSIHPKRLILDANGGTVNGAETVTLDNQYQVPDLSNYIPQRDGGYTFYYEDAVDAEGNHLRWEGWYYDEALTQRATDYDYLTAEETVLYARWVDPLTIEGTVYIHGSYLHEGQWLDVPAGDRATEVEVVLHRISGSGSLDEQVVTFTYDTDPDEATYRFTGLSAQYIYRIEVLALNYTTGYDSNADGTYTAEESTAVFAEGSSTAVVNAHLDFEPESYDQELIVDVSAIGEDFRPHRVEAQIYGHQQHHHNEAAVITQHKNGGFVLDTSAGIASASESVWKYHYDGLLYFYDANVKAIYGDAPVYNADGSYQLSTAPYSISYNGEASWDVANAEASGPLIATLTPNWYPVVFDPNGGSVVGDVLEIPENTTDMRYIRHTWSFDTPVTATAVRDGYTFLGWSCETEQAYENGVINAAVQEMVILTAQWEQNVQITFHANNADCDQEEFRTVRNSGAQAQYRLNSDGTLPAFYDIPAFSDDAAHNRYIFMGWYLDTDSTDRPFAWDSVYTEGEHHVYAHWITLGELEQEADDRKELGGLGYREFGLVGNQIRTEQVDMSAHHGKAGAGLRFIAVLSERVWSAIGTLDSRNSSLAEYGFILAKTAAAQGRATGDDYQIGYKGSNVNGEDTRELYSYVTNLKCSGVPDHYNGETYRLFTGVLTYNQGNKTDAQMQTLYNSQLLGRAYLRYYDANGLLRTYYNDYDGNSKLYGGVCTSYAQVLELVTGQ